MMNVLSVALDNINRATTNLDAVAARFAKISDPQDSVDLSAEIVVLLEARNAVETSLAVLRTANEINKNLVDLIG